MLRRRWYFNRNTKMEDTKDVELMAAFAAMLLAIKPLKHYNNHVIKIIKVVFS